LLARRLGGRAGSASSSSARTLSRVCELLDGLGLFVAGSAGTFMAGVTFCPDGSSSQRSGQQTTLWQRRASVTTAGRLLHLRHSAQRTTGRDVGRLTTKGAGKG